MFKIFYCNAVIEPFWYIKDERSYLWKDSLRYSVSFIGLKKFNCGCWKTEQEAQEFLDNYLKGISVNLDDRLIQCDKDIAALQAEKEKILKEKLASIKKFYLGEIFTAKNQQYFLTRTPEEYVCLIRMEGPEKGYSWRYTIKLPIKEDNKGHYVTQLPTIFPQEFGLDNKYGVEQ